MKLITHHSSLFTLLLLAALSACDEIFEADISGKEVAVIAPADGAEITEGRVSFRWNALDGADKYRVVVVSPDFEQARLVARDTVLYADSLTMSLGFGLTLAPADYQWSIGAFNGAYGSIVSVYSLTVVAKQEEEEPEPEPEPEPESEPEPEEPETPEP